MRCNTSSWFCSGGDLLIMGASKLAASQSVVQGVSVCLHTCVCVCLCVCVCVDIRKQPICMSSVQSQWCHMMCVSVCVYVYVCACVLSGVTCSHEQNKKACFFKTSPFWVAHFKSSDVPYIIVPNTPTQILKDLHKKVLLATNGASCSFPKRPTIRCLRKRPTTLLPHYKRDL